jgi:uncharacterized protein (DUF58 family)
MRANSATHQVQAAEATSVGIAPLLLAAERLAATIIMGEHGRKRAGPGDSFWQYRPYSFGDSTQRIDWRRSARSDHVFIRENEWQAANTLWVWTNTSARMDFSSHSGQTKKDRALLLTLALAALALRADERIGVLDSAEPAGHGRLSLARTATTLLARNPVDLPNVGALRTGGSTVIVSDFLDEHTEIAKALLPIAATKTRGHLVQICDPAEETLPYNGRVEFTGMNSAEKITTNRTQDIRKAYIEKFQAHRELVRGLAASLGWTFTVHRTDQSPTTCLLALHHLISDARSNVGRI